MLCARDATPLAEEVIGSKGPISLALGSWRWGGRYGGGEGRILIQEQKSKIQEQKSKIQEGRDGDWE
jgi:hypothetical protein